MITAPTYSTNAYTDFKILTNSNDQPNDHLMIMPKTKRRKGFGFSDH